MKIRTSKIAIAIIFIIGITVLLGWFFDDHLLKMEFLAPGFAMKPNTALSLVFSGLILSLLQIEKVSNLWRVIGFILALIPMIIGGLTSFEYIFVTDLGMDKFLFPSIESPVRMGVGSALNLILAGMAFMLMIPNHKKDNYRGQILAIFILFINLFVLIFYLFGMIKFHQFSLAKIIEPSTIVSFIILSIGILFTHPEQGLIKTLTSDFSGGKMARLLLPFAIISPIIIIGLIKMGIRSKLYDENTSFVYISIIFIISLTGLIYVNAKKINQLERENNILQKQHKEQTLEIEKLTAELKLEVEEKEYYQKSNKRNDALFKTFINYSPTLAWINSSEHKFVYTNQNFADFIGESSTELLGKTLGEVFTEQMAQKYIENNQLVLEKSTVLETVESAILSDNTIGEFLVYKFLLPEEVGENLVGGVGINITEMRRTEKSLKISESTLQAIVQNVPEYILFLDEYGIIMFINRPISGFSIEQIIGSQINNYIQGESQENLTNYIAEVFTTGEDITLEIRGLSKNNKIGDYMVKIAPMRPNGKIESVIMIATDMSDYKRTEKALKYNEINLKQAQQIAHIGSWEFDLMREKSIWSEELYQIYGLEPNKPTPKYSEMDKYIHPDDLLLYQNEVVEKAQSFQNFEVDLRIVRPGGEIRYVELRGETIYNEQGRPTQLIGTTLDISERKKIELELIKAKKVAELANQAKSQFLANMSHEIRTPMNAILGFAELLKGMITEPKEISYLDIILSSGKTLLDLINDILDLSKIESGKLTLNYEPISLKLLIQEMQLIFSQKVESKGLLLWTEIAHNAPDYIIFDEVRLRQILFNVLSNAIKFTEKGSIKITVAGKINNNLYPKNKSLMTLEISVTDTGIGIEPAEQKRIFAPFIQSEGQSTRKYGGTGLGLAITKKLTEMLGGKINLKSILGKGSKFTFIFYNVEIAESTSELITTYHPDEDFNKFEPSTILIVDDVQSNLDLIGGYFENTHHKLLLVDDGQKAINQALIEKPNLILLDLWMPELNGIDTAKFIRKNPETHNIPIIFITASSHIQDDIDMKEISNGFIRKPVSKRQLFAELQKVLSPWENKKEITIIPHNSEVLKTEEVLNKPVEEIPSTTEVNSSDDTRELLLQLRQEEEVNWYNLSQKITRREIKVFYERLMDLGLEYQCQELMDYAENLAHQLADFDYENLSQTVNYFPQFRLELEKKYSSVVRK